MGEYKCIYSVVSVKTDYIPREAARDLMYHKQSPLTEYDLDEIEAADVAPVKHGRWESIHEYNNGERAIGTCSVCKATGELRTKRNEWGIWNIDSLYCPNCGAKMDGE